MGANDIIYGRTDTQFFPEVGRTDRDVRVMAKQGKSLSHTLSGGTAGGLRKLAEETKVDEAAERERWASFIHPGGVWDDEREKAAGELPAIPGQTLNCLVHLPSFLFPLFPVIILPQPPSAAFHGGEVGEWGNWAHGSASLHIPLLKSFR